MSMKIILSSLLFLLGIEPLLHAQKHSYSFYSFTPKCPHEIYVGAVLDAGSLNENTYRFIPAPLPGITVSSSSPFWSETIIPSRANMEKFIKEGLSSSGALRQDESFSYSVNELDSYQDLSGYMGQATDLSFFFGVQEESESRRRCVVMEISRVFFRLVMDDPDESYREAVVSAGYDDQNLIYVNSIGFGRRVILVVESDAGYSDLKSSLTYQLKKASGEKISKNRELEAIFWNATLRVMLPGSEDANLVIPDKPMESLIQYINQEVTAGNFGVPISFSASVLKSNGMFVNTFSIP